MELIFLIAKDECVRLPITSWLKKKKTVFLLDASVSEFPISMMMPSIFDIPLHRFTALTSSMHYGESTMNILNP